jgi:uncharacterized protein YecT (DUF1311 family)
MRRAILVVGTAFGLWVFFNTAFAIDCDRAKTEPELAICSNPALKAFDDYLAEAYSNVRSIVPVDVFSKVRKSQLEWIKSRDAKCGGNVPCLMQETQQRTAALNGFVQSYIERLRLELLGERGAGNEQKPAPEPPPKQPLNPKDIYTKAAQSVVVVVAFNRMRGDISQGSGVVIARDTVATNCHVLESTDTAVVLFKGTPYRVWGSGMHIDLKP